MSVLVVGLNYRTAPVGLLERVAVAAEQLPKALYSLASRDHVTEAVVLSTCNRVELYVNATRYHAAMGDVRSFLAEWSGLAPDDFAYLAYDYFDDRAAAHLFAVTAGLDSMVVGERQIALQVKQAFQAAQAEGSVGRVLSALFTRALGVGKRVRARTAISDGASSMVDVALEAARHVLGPLDQRTVLVVGAGKMGGMAARRLQGTAGRILVVNRSEDRGLRLADQVAGELLPMSRLGEGLAQADLVLCSTGAATPVVEQEVVAQAMAARPLRPLVLLDIAVPRDVEPGSAFVPGVTVLDVDAIRSLTDSGATGAAVAQARELVDAEAGRFAGWTRSVRVEPTVGALHERGEQIRLAELERLAGRLGELDERQREAVEALSRGIVARLLHEPSVRLKAIADARGGEQHATALRELFDLPPV